MVGEFARTPANPAAAVSIRPRWGEAKCPTSIFDGPGVHSPELLEVARGVAALSTFNALELVVDAMERAS